MFLLLALLGLEQESIVFAFLGGVLLDLSSGTSLGFSSVGYLLPVGIVLLYSRKFQVKSLFFWAILFFTSILVFKLVKGEIWRIKDSLIMLAIGLVVYFILNRWQLLADKEEGGIRLKI